MATSNEKTCGNCGGNGLCPTCAGTGFCSDCGGSGTTEGDCPHCGNVGEIPCHCAEDFHGEDLGKCTECGGDGACPGCDDV